MVRDTILVNWSTYKARKNMNQYTDTDLKRGRQVNKTNNTIYNDYNQ